MMWISRPDTKHSMAIAAVLIGIAISNVTMAEELTTTGSDTAEQDKLEQLRQEADQARQDAMRAQMEADQMRQEAAMAKQEAEQLRQQSEIVEEAKSDAALLATTTPASNAHPNPAVETTTAAPIETVPYERTSSDHPMLDYFRAGTFTDYLIWGYIAISTILGLVVVYGPMMKWYKRQFIFIEARGMVEVFFRRLGLLFSWLLFVLFCAAVVGSLGGNIYAIYKLRRNKSDDENTYARNGADIVG